MKAVIWTKYGPPEVLQVGEVPKPSPGEGEVLIRVRASGVTAGDTEARNMKFAWWLSLPMRAFIGFRRPSRRRILGQELSGVVEAVGPGVTRFKEGDAVFGTTGFRFGSYAEYNCLLAEANDGILAHKPGNLSFEEAGAVATAGLEAVHFLGAANLRAGESILVYGAGGSIGTVGVQLARHIGAQVTAVDRVEKHEMLRELGAERVIDYRQEDFTRRSERYDVIFDVIGKAPLAGSMQALSENGRFVIANPSLGALVRKPWLARDGKQLITHMSGQQTQNMQELKKLLETGAIKVIIDRSYPLEQAAEAHRYAESGVKKGNVVLVVAS